MMEYPTKNYHHLYVLEVVTRRI